MSKALALREKSPTHCSWPEDISFEEWFSDGKRVVGLQNSSLFWLGDWINHGKAKFGGKYRAALEALPNYRYQSLVNIAYVCSRIPAERRRGAPLSFTHHAEVASLDEAEQERWLTLAHKQSLTTIAMRRCMREKAELAHERKEGEREFNVVRWCREGVRWFEDAFSDIRRDDARRAALKQDLRPIVDLYNRL